MTATAIGRARSSRVLQGSAWILIGLGIQALLGFLFWLLGSRVATSDELGQASALFTAIQFVNYASGLGLTIALARHATRRNAESDALFGWAVAATVVSSVIGGVAYLALVDTSATRLVTGSPGGWLLFSAYTAGTSIGLLVDVRLMAARRWGWLVARLAFIGLIRLPLVVLPVSIDPALWLYNLMLAPAALVAVLTIPVLHWIGAGSISWHRPQTLGSVARYAGVNWVATLSSQAPQFILPLVVAQSVRPSVNASFFLAWTVTGLVFLVPAAIAQVLLVEGGKDADGHDSEADAAGLDLLEGDDPASSAAEGSSAAVVSTVTAEGRAKEALAFSLGLATVAWLASLAIGPLFAHVFGPGYHRLGRLLPSLMVAGIPWAITSIRLSEARIRRDQVATVAITLTLGLGILLPTLLFVPDGGTLAATRAWVFGNVAGAVVAIAVHHRAMRASARALVPD
ncbi:hypothetical protein [Aquihabitans sp. McL0605]|uniref:hypothetical protein n=1 Tax=Aquihabitans sp. McL0605 TaxID=3415671 RepID=UPI003CEAA7C9